MNFVPGQWWQRASAFVLVPVAGYLIWLWKRGEISGYAPLATGLLAFLALTTSNARIYDGWMACSERISVIVARVLFTLVYVLVVPFVALLRQRDGLRLDSRSHRGSLWVDRATLEDSVEEMERMG